MTSAVSHTPPYRQIGNSVPVPVVTAIAREMVDFLSGCKII